MRKDYARHAIRGSTIIFAFSILGAGLGFLLRTFLARSLSVEEYGLLYAVIAFFGLFAVFRDLGLNTAIIKYIPEFIVKKDNRSIKSSIVLAFIVQTLVSSLVLAAVILSSHSLAAGFFKTGAAVPVVFYIGLSFALSVLFHLMQSVFQGFQRMDMFAVTDPIRMGIVLAAAYIGLEAGFGINAVAFAYAVAAVAAGIVSFLLFLRIFRFFGTRMTIGAPTRKIIIYALPLVGSGVVSTLVTYVDTIMITYLRDLKDVGYYQAAAPISDISGMLVMAMIIVAFPMISELWTRGKKTDVSKGVSSLTKFSLILLLLPAVIVLVYAETIIGVLFGAQYLAAATTLRILMFAIIVKSLNQIFFTVLNGIGKPGKVFSATVLLSALVVALNIALIPPLGPVGAALATIVAYAAVMLYSLNAVRKSVSIAMSWKDALKIGAAGGATAAIGYYLRAWLPGWDILSIAVCAAAYALFVLALGTISKNELRAIEHTGIRIPGIIYRMAK